ncbi:hypothetical protein GCM10027294_17730 [Marinactinospora endophytica]
MPYGRAIHPAVTPAAMSLHGRNNRADDGKHTVGRLSVVVIAVEPDDAPARTAHPDTHVHSPAPTTEAT